MRKSIYIFLFMAFTHFACHNNNEMKNNISIDKYKTNIIFTDSIDSESLYSFPSGYCKIEFSSKQDELKSIFFCRFCDIKNNNLFQSNDIEIEYFQTRWEETTFCPPSTIPLRILLGIKKIKGKYKCFFIMWQNYPEFMWQNYPEKNESDIEYYSTELGEKTDSIFTNLDYSTIHKFFPQFSGIYKLTNFNNIKISLKYSIKELEFYNGIEFDDKSIGMEMYFKGRKSKVIMLWP